MKSNRPALAILLLLFATSSIFAQENVKVQDPEKYFSRKEKQTFERAIGYEAAFYNRIFPDKKISFSDVNFTVIPNHMQYIIYRQNLGGAFHRNSLGVYFPATHELVVCSDKKYKKIFIEVSSHELSHAFLHLHSSGKNIPAWLNEGLAVYLQQMTFGKKTVKQRINQHYLARVKTLIELKDLNLAEFVAWDYQKFSSESFSQEGYGYAVGYCLTLFLMQRDEDNAIAIFRNLVGEQTSMEVFDAHYPGGFAQLEKDFTERFK
ncbi:MAG: DUF1570 domain-containing protein [Prevotellaceae bacterium]|jgi:hypothetical protein|nr:DUF1570 domain-containing protein [Prevotellaceae bacterium]